MERWKLRNVFILVYPAGSAVLCLPPCFAIFLSFFLRDLAKLTLGQKPVYILNNEIFPAVFSPSFWV